MRRAILAAGFLAICGNAALAADILSPRAPDGFASMRSVYNWTGLYVGANVGGGWTNTSSEFNFAGGAPFASANNSLNGVLGGVQLGYNWQSGQAVFGFETDFQFAGMRGSIDAPPCPAAVCGVATSASYSQKMPWFGTVRARLGYASDTWLIYGTGGFAYARLDTDASASAGGVSATLSRSETRTGWTVGGGIELAFSRNWTAKMEYLYADFGSRDGSWLFAGVPALNDRIRVYDNLVRAGLNYRF